MYGFLGWFGFGWVMYGGHNRTSVDRRLRIPEHAPKTVNTLVFLAGEGFYNGTTFHRVIDGFITHALEAQRHLFL